SLGRAKGLRVTLISQRPAKLHKDSLTQTQALIVLRVIWPQDRAAVAAWIEGQAEKKQGDEIMQSLPSLQDGHGWIWVPALHVLSRIAFPKIKTFDSSRAPEDDEDAPALAQLDTADIQAALETVARDVVENDPGRLKK